MNRGILVLVIGVISFVVRAVAQSSGNAAWVGIWNAHLDGVPTGTLTLATDTGELEGTVVLDMISCENGVPHVIVRDPHALIEPHVDHDTLSFQVRINRRDGQVAMARFTVTRTGVDQASIHCLDCGGDAPVVKLVKEDSTQ